MSETTTIKPLVNDKNVIVQFSGTHIFDKHTYIYVPSEFEAHLYVNEEWKASIDSNINDRLVDIVGKKFIGENIKVVYVRIAEPHLLFPLGFGSILIKNNKLHEIYHLGGNGQYSVKIDKTERLIKAFGMTDNISLEMIKLKIKPCFDSLIKPVLTKYFANSNISALEIDGSINDVRNIVVEVLNKAGVFEYLGLKLNSLIIRSLYIPDDDLEKIKSSFDSLSVSKNEITELNAKINTIIKNQKSKKILLTNKQYKDLNAADIYKRNKKSVVLISSEFDDYCSVGTGFIIDKGVMLTSAHVVVKREDNKIVSPSSITCQFDKSKTTFKLKLIDYNLDLDIAYLKISNDIGTPIKISNKSPIKGERCFVMGNQLGKGAISILSGDISDDSRKVGKHKYIVISVPINVGNSGGPLFNSKGELIGLIRCGEKGSTSMNYAIPNKTLQLYMNKVSMVK